MQRYEAYKDSGVEWIGEIPEGWEVAKFGLYSTVHSGIAFQGAVSEEKQVPIFGGGNVIGYSDVSNVDSPALIVGRVGGNEPSYFDCSIWATDNALVIDTSIDKKYAYYSLLSADLSSMATSTSQPLLTASKVRSLRVPVPASCEQQAIADYLDGKTAEIDSIVSQTELSIELLREYRKSVISEAVTKGLDPDAPMKDSGVEWIGEIPEGWECCTIKYVTNGLQDGTHGTYKRTKNGIPLLSAKNIAETGLHISSEESLISEDDAMEITANGFPREGDVLFACIGASIGKTCIYPFDRPLPFQRSVAMIRPGKKIIGRYLAYAMRSDSIQQEAQAAQNRSTQGGLYLGLIGGLHAAYPVVSEQQAIADYLDGKTAQIDSLIADKKRQVELLKEYRKSLISEAVTGKFKVPGLG